MSVLLISGFVAMLVPGMGIIGTIDCIILKGYELLCTFFEKLPCSTWNPGRPSKKMVVLYYVILAGIVLYINCTKIKNKNISLSRLRTPLAAICMIFSAVICLGMHSPVKTNSVTFLDVGQGDSIVVRTDGGGVYIFDCGSSSRSSVGKYVLKPYLKYYGISRIDAVVVSHSDTDHCNGITELLENADEWGIEVGSVIIPDVADEDFTNILSDGIDEASKKRLYENVYSIKSGDFFNDGSMTFTCLHPPKKMEGEDSNALSACFLISFPEGTDQFNILLTGDVEENGEEMLCSELKQREITDVDVLKVAHHGSKYSTSEEILEQISPKLAVISCGKNNRYGHPHEETLERLYEAGSVVLCTKDSGAVILYEKKDAVRVAQWGKK
jgi:competence protein ComEC